MKAILQKWTIMRGLRLLLGVIVLIQSIASNDMLFGAMSLLFIAMPLFNVGCCAGGECGVGLPRNKTDSAIEDVEFVEIRNKQ